MPSTGEVLKLYRAFLREGVHVHTACALEGPWSKNVQHLILST